MNVFTRYSKKLDYIVSRLACTERIISSGIDYLYILYLILAHGKALQSLYSLIEKILSYNGFDSYRSDEYIIANREGSEAALCLQMTFDMASLNKFVSKFNSFRGKKILVVMNGLPEEIAYDIDPDVIIWDKNSLEDEIKRAKIEDSLNEKNCSILDEITATDFPPLISEEVIDEVEKVSLCDIILKLNYAEKDVDNDYPDCTLKSIRLVPYYVFKYSIKSEDFQSKSMNIAVNAVSMRPEAWGNVDVVYSLEVEHSKMQPAITVSDGEQIALQEIIESNSSVREYIFEDKSTTLKERRKIAPKENEIEIEYQNTYYVPIWYIKNEGNEIYVNGHNKKIVDFCKSPIDRSPVHT